jgi:tetratricopeptide (TPR) repeat protein
MRLRKKAKPDNRKVRAVDAKAAVSAAKGRTFRWVAALGLPVFLMLVLELALRLFGWGYPTHFFLRSDAQQVYAENEKFGWRFFPRRLARAPDPIRLTRTKAADTFRIFVFGESAALGDPEPAYGFSRILRELLEARCPGTRFEVINTGMTAINSHAILPIARDCVPFDGDVWILYMGNNEVVGPFGAGSVFGAKSPPLSIIRANLALKRTRLGQALDWLWQRAPAHAGQPAQWEGMKMMVDQQIRAEDPALARVYDHFSRNLTDILSAAARAGVKPIVCSVSSNLKDCAPFASLNRAGVSGSRKTQWEALVSHGAGLESQKDHAKALAEYRQAAEIDDSYAALAFRMARCYGALGEDQSARAEYIRARDLDALRFRADTAINRIIQNTCASRADAVHFFDSESVLTNACQQGIPGAECFWDHVHLNFKGNYLVACGLANQVLGLLPESVRRSGETNGCVLTETQCTERLAYTDWDQSSVLREMQRRINEPPFTSQLGHKDLVRRWSGFVTELDQKLGHDGMAIAEKIYRDALTRRPDDWILHNRLAFVLEAEGDVAGAAQHWRATVEQVPERVQAWFKLGDMSVRGGKPTEAEQDYRRVLELRPTSFEAMNGLGLLYMDKGNVDEAIRFFKKALEVNPKFAQVHVNWGLLESRRGKPDAAEAHYREALRYEPDSAGAHINLGNLLAAQQKHSKAIEQYIQAVRIQPSEGAVRLSLADSLAAAGRGSEAVARYQEAIRLNPALAEAHFNLGVALAKQGNLAAATDSFQEACRLNPKDAQTHLNFGVALAQQRRFHEAVDQFQEVLRLDPANAAARQYLQMAQSKAGLGP